MNIDRLARVYRWIEYAAFGRALEQARFAFLDRLAAARRVLTLGEGDGRALARLLFLAPQVRVDVVEVGGEMIALARRRVGNPNRVQFRQENALTAAWPENHYDGVITMFFLDCFSEDETSLIEQIASTMAPGALWLISEFAIPEQGWRRWHARIWIWVMYRFFAATTRLRTRSLPDIEQLLLSTGLRRLERAERRAGLIRAEVWQKTARPGALLE